LNAIGDVETVTASIVRRAAAISRRGLSADESFVARQRILDWIGVGIAGSTQPVAAALLQQTQLDGGSGHCSVIGCSSKVGMRQAALVNGTLGHALDYDDTHPEISLHVTAATLPALLAMAERQDVSGPALLAAYAGGYEAGALIGLYMGTTPMKEGFHLTGILGSLSAAVGASLVAGLDERTICIALAISATQAGGLRMHFGTMCKPLHAGKAAENGILAAQLAPLGFTASDDVLGCYRSFTRAHRGDANYDALARGLETPDALLLDGLFKYHAACHGGHAAFDALIELREQGLTACEVEHVTLCMSPFTHENLSDKNPRNGLEAKFSVPFIAAMVIAGHDTGSPEAFGDRVVADPALLDLVKRIDFQPDAALPQKVATVEIKTRSGATVSGSFDGRASGRDYIAQGRRIETKFRSLVEPRHGEAAASRIVAAVERLADDTSARALMTLLRSFGTRE
jgi:2-methylcitrate dehydratase PrpD